MGQRQLFNAKDANDFSQTDIGGGLPAVNGTIRTNGTTMTHLNVSKAREEFPDVVNRAAYGKERTIVSRRGKELAAVIPIEDLRLLERLAREEMDRQDIADARAALAERGKNIPLRDLMRELED
jgi:prevent-host-death family protein